MLLFWSLGVTAQHIEASGWLADLDPRSPHYLPLSLYDKDGIPHQKPWSYPHLREADVAFAQRYERVIDIRQKRNMALQHPKLGLTYLLFKIALVEGNAVYADRNFNQVLNKQEILRRMTTEEMVQIMDTTSIIEDAEFKDSLIRYPIRAESIVKFRVIEEWIFDKNHSRMIPRIVAIAPIYRPTVAGGTVELNEQAMFWLKYDDIRPYLVNAEVFQPSNETAALSYDHFFQARYFDSYVVREPNVLDMDIAHYPEFENNGLAALLRSEEAKNGLFVMEHDLWEY